MPITSAALGPIIFRTGYERPINFSGRRTHFCRELSAEVKFLDAAGVHPEVLYTVIGSLPSVNFTRYYITWLGCRQPFILTSYSDSSINYLIHYLIFRNHARLNLRI